MKRNFLIWTCAAALFSLISFEAIARYGLGLGTPPLSVSHPKIEYMFAPNQRLMRFGNRQIFNAYGMRSEAIPENKPDNEFRVIAMGDSVLNGGSLEDHKDLATTLLSTDGRRVLNVSAGSWGPQNMLAYVEEFGLFEADFLVVVLSDHDAGDSPTFELLNPNTHPTTKPFLALTEGIIRYLPRYFPSQGRAAPGGSPVEPAMSDPNALDAVRSLAGLPIAKCFVFHPTRGEYLAGDLGEGHRAIKAAVREEKIVYASAFIGSSEDFRDGIHLSTSGQTALARAMETCWN